MDYLLPLMSVWLDFWVFVFQNLSRYLRLPRASPSSASRVSALLHLDDSDTGTVCVARSDRESREVFLEFFDALSQVRISEVGGSEHFHSREVNQMHFLSGTFVTTSGDCVMIWSYMNTYHIDSRCGGSLLSLLKHEGHHSARGNVPIIRSEITDSFVLVLLKKNVVEILSKKTGTSLHRIENFTASFSCIGMSAVENILLIHGGSEIRFFNLEDQFECIAIFTSNRSRFVSVELFDPNSLFILTDNGVVDIVDIHLNRKIGSTEKHCKTAIGLFGISRQRMIAVGHKSHHFDIFNLKRFVEESSQDEQDASKPYFNEPHTEITLNRESITSISLASQQHHETYIKFFMLPLNQKAFRVLVSSPSLQTEMNFWNDVMLSPSDPKNTLVFKSEKIVKRLAQQLGLLSAWNPQFKAFPSSFPKTIFPFVKLFGRRPLVCFELIAFFLSNFCRFTVEREIIDKYIKGLLTLDDRHFPVYCHLQNLLPEISVSEFLIEKILSNLLTQLIPAAEWLRMLDRLAIWFRNSHRQHFDDKILVRIIVEFIKSQEESILCIRTRNQLEDWTETQKDLMPGFMDNIFSSAISDKPDGAVFILPENVVHYPDFPN